MTSATAVSPKIVGKALYLELVANPELSEDRARSALGWQHRGTQQVIIFPQYQDDTGKIHDPIIMRRIVSSHTPKAQWEINRVSEKPKPLTKELIASSTNSYVMLDTYYKSDWDSLTEVEKHESRKLGMEIILRELLISSASTGEVDENGNSIYRGVLAWAVRDNKPIAVELTDEDYRDLIHNRKTPQAVIRRINKVRGTLDKFPDKLA
jgi:hypothetical protein